jgi:PAS domain S-box-containing protein
MDGQDMALAATSSGPWTPADDFALLDAMPANTAILNSRGDIMAVSESWRQFAYANGYQDPALGVGRNYFQICDAAADLLVAAKVRTGIAQILNGRRSGIELEYPCHGPDKKRWFRLHAAPIAFKNELGALVMHTDITAEFLARRDLRRGIRRFQEVAEIMSDWLWEADTEFRVTYVSDRFSETLGIHAADALGKVLDDVLAFADGVEDSERFCSLLIAGKRFRDESFRLRLPDGRVRTCRFGGGTMIDTKGNLRGYRGTVADITEQVEAQARADAVNRRLLEAIDKMPRGMTLWDEKDRLIHANSAYRKVYPGLGDMLKPGLAFETLYRAIVDHGFIVISDPDREAFIRKRLADRRKSSHTITYQMNDGRWAQIGVDLLSDGTLANFHTDVTDIKKAEQDSKRQSELLQSILDNMSEGIIVTDVDARLVAWNDSLRAMFGLADDLFRVGGELRDVSLALARRGELGPGDPEQLADERMERIKAGIGKVREVTRASGETLQVGSYPMPDGGIIIVYTDITAQKRAEVAKLEAEARARHMQKMDAVGTLAGGIAHELNNALVPIISLTKRTLKTMPAESRERENLAVVAAAAARSRELVGKILNFARKSGGAEGVTRVADGIEAAVKTIAATMPERISVSTAIAKEVGLAHIESDELQQVLINLATNATHAIGDRAGHIRIEAAMDGKEPADGRRLVKITVRDDGPGIAADVRERIFEPFFTTKPVGKGTGLGLSLVHSIVTNHGGRIELDSEPGAGAAFHVLLEDAPEQVAPDAHRR